MDCNNNSKINKPLILDIINTIIQFLTNYSLIKAKKDIKNKQLLQSIISFISKAGYLKLDYELVRQNIASLLCVLDNGTIITSKYIINKDNYIINTQFQRSYTLSKNRAGNLTNIGLTIYNRINNSVQVYKEIKGTFANIWVMKDNRIILLKTTQADMVIYNKDFVLVRNIKLKFKDWDLYELSNERFILVGLNFIQLYCSITYSLLKTTSHCGVSNVTRIHYIKSLSNGDIFSVVEHKVDQTSKITHGIWDFDSLTFKISKEGSKMFKSICETREKVLFYDKKEITVYVKSSYNSEKVWVYDNDIEDINYLVDELIAVRDCQSIRLGMLVECIVIRRFH
jgi:hypothetical protein